MDKAEVRRLKTEIRQIFLSNWDPIGISDIATEEGIEDEYDSYIPQILASIRSDSLEEVAAVLVGIEQEQMGLAGNLANARLVAAELKKLTR